MRKTLKEVRKTGFKTLFKSYIKQAKGIPFYRGSKTSRWESTQQKILLSVDWLVDQPTVKNMTVGAAGRPHPTLDLWVVLFRFLVGVRCKGAASAS